MLKQISLSISLMLIIISMSGCAIFNRFYPDKSLDYQKHDSAPDLEMPTGIRTNKIQDLMPVPVISDELQSVDLPKELSRPAALKVGLMHLGIQKRSSGDRHWIFIDKPASNVWPEVENYFKEKRLAISSFEPRKGFAETNWLNGKDSYLSELLTEYYEESDKKLEGIRTFRFRLELQPGLQRYTSRLQLLISLNGNGWSKVSDSLELEEIILDDMTQFLGEKLDQKSSVSLLAQEMTRQFKADVVDKEEEQPYLLINQDFNQGWFLVGKAIREASMPLYDVNRSLGLYYLSIDHDDARKFTFTRAIKINKVYKNLENHNDFQLEIDEKENGVEVKVKLSDETFANREFSLFVLDVLHKNILKHNSL